MRIRRAALIGTGAAVALCAGMVQTAGAQSPRAGRAPPVGRSPPPASQSPAARPSPLELESTLDSALRARGPYACMHTLYERTIFQVDVLTADICFGRETARRLRDVAAGGSSRPAVADSAVQAILEADRILTRVRFERAAPLSEFLKSVRGNMRKAVWAGILPSAGFHEVTRNLPKWFAFLDERGIEDGDRLLYRIHGDTLRTIYISRDDRVLLDQTDVGREHRLAVLGGYFAPQADLRSGLLRSLFEAD